MHSKRVLFVYKFEDSDQAVEVLFMKRNMDKLKKISLIEQLDCLEEIESKRERKDLFVEMNEYDFRRWFRLTKESVVELPLLIHEKLERNRQ
ncbi:hypothetical protein AVEN_69040-1 [Araneus ventricosus]|uniref:Uncharacterized protein n=1 Tax=Araneus ventricosus TaxID=182803 RepID=A0A4Y2W600_ARAVE|nr:hypothetical protein AVEN_69040-1 [Araneus ventricosus]